MTLRSFSEFEAPADPWRLSIAHAGNGLLVGQCGPVCLSIWRTKPRTDLFEVQRRELAAAVARDPGNAAFLCVVEASAEPPEQDVRDASAAMLTSHGKRLAACACVIEGTGFRAAITRTVLTGMALVARNVAPNRFFERVQVASFWLSEHLGRGRDPLLSERVEMARARLRVT